MTPIKLGVLANISPALANQGAMMRSMTDDAVQAINAASGINGRPVQVAYADPKGDPSAAVQLATQFVQQDNVDALVGAVSSAEWLRVQDVAAKPGTVYVTSTGCATDALTSNMWRKPSSLPARAAGWCVMEASLARAGGALKVKIAMPLSEPHVTPNVSQIPTDGSVNGHPGGPVRGYSWKRSVRGVGEGSYRC